MKKQRKMNNYSELETKLGIKFKNEALLDKAFTHRSYLNEHRGDGIENNERLEFLGDAVLELIISTYLVACVSAIFFRIYILTPSFSLLN